MSELTTDQIMNFLSSMRLFSQFNASIIQKIVSFLKIVNIKRGSVLMKENEAGNSMYFVFGGRLKATITEDDGSETLIGEIGQGEIIGEIALILGEPRIATIRALRDSVLLEFSRENFDNFTKDCPEAAMNIARFCVKRLITKKPYKRIKVTTVALVPAGENLLFSEFAMQFANTLGVIGSTLHLNQKKFQELYNQSIIHIEKNTLEDKKITSWLHEQEDKHNYVVYETDPTLTQWTLRCLKHADRIIYVGSSNTNPALNEIEIELSRNIDNTYLSKELVLLHKTKNQPSQTKAWLTLRQLTDHHHMKIDSPKDYSKLIRFFTGNALGLVLGGGGTRGFGYVGLLRALEELRIEFDMVGGCSIGAGIGAFYASGYNSKEIHKKVTEFIKAYDSSIKYTFPMLSLMTGSVMWDQLHKGFGDTQIEDLWKKYFCVSTNLSKGDLEIYTSGSLWRHIATSMAIPGILPPTVDDQGNLHVDGGVINNLPVDVMRKHIGSGKIIAVGISSQIKQKYDPIEIGTSGWRILFEKLFYSKKHQNKIPNISEVIVSSMTLAGDRNVKVILKNADHFIDLNVKNYKLLQTKGIDELINSSYLACIKQLEKIFNK
jgi:predicted acylesterase/phospholipase RssA